MKELTVALLIWISSNTPLAYDGSHAPELVSVSQQQLVHIFYQGDIPQGTDLETFSVAGVYNYKDGKVYLLQDVDLTTIEGKAVLVHELVHYLQYHHGLDKSVDCMSRLERAAYETQAKYLTRNGKIPAFNELHVLLVSNCWHL